MNRRGKPVIKVFEAGHIYRHGTPGAIHQQIDLASPHPRYRSQAGLWYSKGPMRRCKDQAIPSPHIKRHRYASVWLIKTAYNADDLTKAARLRNNAALYRLTSQSRIQRPNVLVA